MKIHWLYYLVMGLIFLGGFISIFSFGFSRQTQMLFIVAVAFFYVALGIWHHMKSHDMHVKIVIEYIIMASLGITVTYFLLQAGT